MNNAEATATPGFLTVAQTHILQLLGDTHSRWPCRHLLVTESKLGNDSKSMVGCGLETSMCSVNFGQGLAAALLARGRAALLRIRCGRLGRVGLQPPVPPRAWPRRSSYPVPRPCPPRSPQSAALRLFRWFLGIRCTPAFAAGARILRIRSHRRPCLRRRHLSRGRRPRPPSLQSCRPSRAPRPSRRRPRC